MLFLLVTLSFVLVSGGETKDDFTFGEWKTQIETILQETHKWKQIMESAMAQFALAKFPENFTPETFAKNINETVVLGQQRTTLRSLIYHRALSTMDDTLSFPLPPGVSLEAGKSVIGELRDCGFPAYWLEDQQAIFFSKKK